MLLKDTMSLLFARVFVLNRARSSGWVALLLIVALGSVDCGWAQSSNSGASVQAGEDGFRLVSGSDAFELRLRGDLYTDARVFPGTDAGPGSERIYLRRVRPRLQGRVYDRFAFSIRPDFGIGGPEIDDAFVEARFAPSLRVRMGRFKVPVGLEALSSTTGLMHVERGFPTGLVPGRDVGIMLTGAIAQERVQYAMGLFNGVPGASESGAEVDNTREGAARVFVEPFLENGGLLEGLGFGIGGTAGPVTGTSATPALTTLQTTGRQPFFQYRSGARADGGRWRVAPQARLYTGPLELLGEYTVTSEAVRIGAGEARLRHRAWQASASVVLTGEDAREGSVVPRDPFAAESGRGAVELGARVQGAVLDDDAFPGFVAPASAASSATAWGLTVSWYPNAMVRFMLGLERTTFEAAGTASTRDAENVVLTRMQIAF